MTKTNIYGKIMEARLMFLQSNPQKSGRNDFQKFHYYELDDIVPTATRICNELGIYTEVDMGSKFYGFATMTAINIDEPKEQVHFRLKMPEINNANINNALQDTGRLETYLRRYLYMLFLDIAQNDEVDASDNSVKQREKPKTSPRKPTGANSRRLTKKQRDKLASFDPILEKIIKEDKPTTLKEVVDGLNILEENNELTHDKRLEIAKKISTL